MATAFPTVPTAQGYRAPGPYDEDYRSIARREQLAQILQQQALQPIEVGSYQGIQAPISPLSGIAKVLQGYFAGKQSDEADQARQDLAFKAGNQELALSNLPPMVRNKPQELAKALEQPSTTYGEGMPPVAQAPIAQATEPVAQAMPGGSSGAMQTPTQAPVQAQGQIPMLSSDPKFNALLVKNMGQQEYLKALAKTLEPTPEMKNIGAIFGKNSPEYLKAMQDFVFKGGYVPGQVVAEGGALIPAGKTAPSYIAPKSGIQTTITPTGPVASPVAGYGPTISAINQAEEYGKGTGKAQTTPAEALDAQGRTIATTQAANMGLPPIGMPTGQAPNRTPVVTKESPVMQAANIGLNEDWRKNVAAPVFLQGQTAQKTLDSVSVLRNTDLQTGFGTETKANIANMLAAAGVKDAEKFATNAQIFQKESSKALLDRLASQKGPQTERDALTGRETFVTLADTPQAKDFTLDLAQAMAQQDQRKAGYFQKASDMPEVHKGKLGSISTEWSKVEGSVFDMPIGRTPDGKPITMRQKYGIK
jgi:hypothetical protein